MRCGGGSRGQEQGLELVEVLLLEKTGKAKFVVGGLKGKQGLRLRNRL